MAAPGLHSGNARVKKYVLPRIRQRFNSVMAGSPRKVDPNRTALLKMEKAHGGAFSRNNADKFSKQ
jgi:hypothetical protein